MKISFVFRNLISTITILKVIIVVWFSADVLSAGTVDCMSGVHQELPIIVNLHSKCILVQFSVNPEFLDL